MDNTVLGIIFFFGFWHIFLIVIPIGNLLRARISPQSGIAWCAVLILKPFAGVVIMHFIYGTGLFHRTLYEVSTADERARSGSLARRSEQRMPGVFTQR